MGMDLILSNGKILPNFNIVSVSDNEVAGFKKGEKTLIVINREDVELVINY